jgi:hypothetical protein
LHFPSTKSLIGLQPYVPVPQGVNVCWQRRGG